MSNQHFRKYITSTQSHDIFLLISIPTQFPISLYSFLLFLSFPSDFPLKQINKRIREFPEHNQIQTQTNTNLNTIQTPKQQNRFYSNKSTHNPKQ